MNSIGNLLWLILGGILVAIIYFLVGLLMCITIIGIPFGVQLFKLGGYALWPFGHELVDKPGEPGCLSIVMNLLWILLGWRSSASSSASPSWASPSASSTSGWRSTLSSRSGKRSASEARWPGGLQNQSTSVRSSLFPGRPWMGV